MSRKIFGLNTGVVFVVLAILNFGSVPAQTCTPGQVAKMFDAQCTLTDSVLTDDGFGNVGIGTTTPFWKLNVQTPTESYGMIHTAGDISVGTWVGSLGGINGGWLGTVSNHPLILFTNDTVKSMVIDTAGRVGIWTKCSDARAVGDGRRGLQ